MECGCSTASNEAREVSRGLTMNSSVEDAKRSNVIKSSFQTRVHLWRTVWRKVWKAEKWPPTPTPGYPNQISRTCLWILPYLQNGCLQIWLLKTLRWRDNHGLSRWTLNTLTHKREAEGIQYTQEKVTWRWNRERSSHKPRNANGHQKLKEARNW